MTWDGAAGRRVDAYTLCRGRVSRQTPDPSLLNAHLTTIFPFIFEYAAIPVKSESSYLAVYPQFYRFTQDGEIHRISNVDRVA